MSALFTALALVGFGVAAWRVVSALLDDDRPTRAAVALVLAAAMLCASYGVLGQLCERRAADVELVFHGDPVAAPRSSRNEGAGELRVIDDVVTRARATPGALAAFALPLLVASLALRRRRAVVRARDRRTWPWSIPLVLAGLTALWSTPRGYDALWYHLPLAAAFARNHHLEPPGRDLVFYFPGNVELVARSLFDLFGGVLGARALSLVQLPFALALAPIATAIARRLGAGRASLHCGAIAIASPMVVFQAGLGYADVVSLAGLGAAMIFLLDALHRDGRILQTSVAAGACLGFVLGSKYAAVPLLATLAPVLVLVAWRRRRLLIAGALAIGVVLPAWFWYARNLRLTGNPFFPIAIPSLVGSSRVDLQACKLEYSIVSPK